MRTSEPEWNEIGNGAEGGVGKGGMRLDGVANKLVFRNVNFFVCYVWET